MPQTGAEPPTYTFESLGYMVADRHMDPYFAEFVPLPEHVEPRTHMHTGFEFLYLVAGELALRHGEQEAKLGPGDAVYFDAGTPHSYRCAGAKSAEAVIVTMHQVPTDHPQSQRASAVAAPTRPPALSSPAAKAGAPDSR
jgi:quercetin dioxygenase-like cupin family protein